MSAVWSKDRFPFIVYLDGIVLKRSWAGEVRNDIAIGGDHGEWGGLSGDAFAKGPRRTRPPGARSSSISRNLVSSVALHKTLLFMGSPFPLMTLPDPQQRQGTWPKS
jgi:hypothetical protein